ncbi:hypothetical protein A8F94_17215 [Bacillus sp. FJAT-27225]|uniref:hypothetical protein n=1 Tax=Bacillus sp. FJAT-27225 TaxID=1743144 RepID=UPI00080C2BDD|nr:hypothetical protein [Bacillus sp. FJAT-27225]OCA84439.1 hypothetical protein A8F94_17215 [Bacillus sp. FJAT-27225]
MNITTIIELENREVEDMARGRLVFAQEQIDENIVETCVECFETEETKESISTEDAMQRVFEQLKETGIIPSEVEDFSFEMPSCGQVKKAGATYMIPQKVILTYMS